MLITDERQFPSETIRDIPGTISRKGVRKMRIVIIGDGKVGFKLAKQLSEEDYDIVLVDNNEKKLKAAIDKLDIFCVAGDGASADVQKEAGVSQADLVIACASTDEFNMLACLIARKLGAKHTIARVRNPIYHRQIDLLKEDLRLSMVVNPEWIVSQEISRLLIFPDVSKIETFVKGKVELIELPLLEDNPLVGLSLKEMYIKYKIKLLVCAVEREEQVVIPDGEFVMQSGDHLHISASHEELERFFKLLKRKRKIRNVLIAGGGKVSFYLAKQLLSLGMQVKIIELNEEKCEDLCEMLPKATIIHGDATDHDLLLEEGINQADAFIALTGMDEENIILSFFAKKQGVQKIIVKVNEDRRMKLISDDFGLDCVVSAKTVTADAIISYVRARHNSQGSANVETMYRLIDGKVEALEFAVRSETSYTQIPLKELKLKPGNLIACIARNRNIIIPNGDDCIQEGDNVVVITMESRIQDILDIIR